MVEDKIRSSSGEGQSKLAVPGSASRQPRAGSYFASIPLASVSNIQEFRTHIFAME